MYVILLSYFMCMYSSHLAILEAGDIKIISQHAVFIIYTIYVKWLYVIMKLCLFLSLISIITFNTV